MTRGVEPILDPQSWNEAWVPFTTDKWAHSDITIAHGGRVLLFDNRAADLVLLGPSGIIERRVATKLTAPHGITYVWDDAREEALWVADCGITTNLRLGGYDILRSTGRVVLLNFEGTERAELLEPPLPQYARQGWAPTAVAAADDLVWVADGYGASLLHAFDAKGRHIRTIDGSGTGAPFRCPHGLLVDTRAAVPRLLIADRNNRRIVACALDGTDQRVLTEASLNSPSAIVACGDLLIVAELRARLTLLNADGSLLGYVGHDPAAPERDGWPNAAYEGGSLVAPVTLSGKFNSPHGLDVGPDGEVFVSEWLIGGRYIRMSLPVEACDAQPRTDEPHR